MVKFVNKSHNQCESLFQMLIQKVGQDASISKLIRSFVSIKRMDLANKLHLFLYGKSLPNQAEPPRQVSTITSNNNSNGIMWSPQVTTTTTTVTTLSDMDMDMDCSDMVDTTTTRVSNNNNNNNNKEESHLKAVLAKATTRPTRDNLLPFISPKYLPKDTTMSTWKTRYTLLAESDLMVSEFKHLEEDINETEEVRKKIIRIEEDNIDRKSQISRLQSQISRLQSEITQSAEEQTRLLEEREQYLTTVITHWLAKTISKLAPKKEESSDAANKSDPKPSAMRARMEQINREWSGK